MLRCGLFEGRALAVFADDSFEQVFLARSAGREHGDDLAVEDWEG
jgi:hypothetical protein